MSFATIEGITNSLISEYPESQAWNASPFSWIRHLPPGSKNVVGRHVATGLLQAYGITATSHTQQIRVNGQGISVKVALKWQQGIIKFQNIRDTNFDYALCLGLYPNRAFGWLIPKSEIWLDHSIRKDRSGVTSQHKGADAWVHVNPENIQA